MDIFKKFFIYAFLWFSCALTTQETDVLAKKIRILMAINTRLNCDYLNSFFKNIMLLNINWQKYEEAKKQSNNSEMLLLLKKRYDLHDKCMQNLSNFLKFLQKNDIKLEEDATSYKKDQYAIIQKLKTKEWQTFLNNSLADHQLDKERLAPYNHVELHAPESEKKFSLFLKEPNYLAVIDDPVSKKESSLHLKEPSNTTQSWLFEVPYTLLGICVGILGIVIGKLLCYACNTKKLKALGS